MEGKEEFMVACKCQKVEEADSSKDNDNGILKSSSSSEVEEKEIVESAETQASKNNELFKKQLDNLERALSNKNSKIKKLESKLKSQKEKHRSIESGLCYII